jgi:predicted alpha/beta-hydrolase family hydrolase
MVDHLALVLAGAGYGPDGPVLTLPSQALAQAGAEVVVVPYPTWRPGGNEQWRVEFLDLVHASIAGLVAQRTPRRLTFVGKSLGTEVVACLPPAVVAATAEVDVLWLTPVFGRDVVREGAVAKEWPCLVVSGAADPSYDEAATDAVVRASRAGSTLLIPGADHALVVGGDVGATVEGWRRLADAVLVFADQ